MTPASAALRLASALLVGAAALAAAHHSPALAQSASTKDRAKKSAPAKGASADASRQRQLQTEQQRLQARLAGLKKQLADAEASHSEASDALRESEASISAVNRRLRELSQSRGAVERQITALQERSRAAAARQTDQERQLGQILRLQYVAVQQSPWQLLLAGEPPQQAERDAVYLGYLAREKTQLIDALQERREELALLEAESRDKRAELAAIEQDEAAQRAQLVKQQAARKQTLDKLARRIGEQRQSIAGLERDEKRLGSLVAELEKLLAEQAAQAARERERQSRTAQAAAPRPAPPRPVAKGPAGTPATEADLPTTGQFAQLRGKLVLPVKGEVTARFGSPRRTEAGVNAPTWKGVFIRASAGQEVLAVAPGRVVFADWLRGFGNLAIVDHGEGFLSVYGNNESVLVSVGERVAAGEPLATVGASGGNAESGLYFELRFQGRPFDPLRWVAAR